MSKHCCEHETLNTPSDPLLGSQRKVLVLALLVNLGVLAVEIWGGLVAGSQAVLADAIHLFSHVFVIVLSLIALKKEVRWKAKAAALKALLVFALGVGILFEAWGAVFDPGHLPEAWVMSVAAVTALVGNFVTLFIMARRRNDDLNMRSAWVCSQADLLTNVGLIGASVLVSVTQQGWPDGTLGLLLGVMIVRSALVLLKQSVVVLRA